jgi:preprotein translocase subunit SecG
LKEGEVRSGALAILVVGIVMLLISLGADLIGIGGSPGIFGYKQVAGTLAGIILALVGAFLYLRSPKA